MSSLSQLASLSGLLVSEEKECTRWCHSNVYWGSIYEWPPGGQGDSASPVHASHVEYVPVVEAGSLYTEYESASSHSILSIFFF